MPMHNVSIEPSKAGSRYNEDRPGNWQPFTSNEFRKFATNPRKPDYPKINSIEYHASEQPRWGGFGFVYRAKDTRLDREVAVKVAYQRSEGDKEAKTLAKYQHPNIVTVYSTGLTDDGRRFIVMEWLNGGSLKDLLEGREKNKTFHEWAILFEKIALALDHVHTQEIHRDIKPSNILFSEDGNPKLADFGLAVSGTVGSDHSGTPEYQAREQRNGTPTRFSDVFSLGVSFWQCLNLKEPPSEELPSPPPMSKDIPVTLAAIVKKCMRLEQLERFGLSDKALDAEAQRPALFLAQDLRAYLDKKPTLSHPLNFWQRVSLWAYREKWQAITLAVTFLGCIASVTFALLEKSQREKADHANMLKLKAEHEARTEVEKRLNEQRIGNMRRYSAQLKQVQQRLRIADSQAAIAELDRCEEPLRGWEWYDLRGRCDGAVRTFKFKTPIQSVAIDRKGQLAVAVWSGKIYYGGVDEHFPNVKPFLENQNREFRQLWFASDRLWTSSITRRHSTTTVAGNIDNHPLSGQARFELISELYSHDELIADTPAVPVIAPDNREILFLGEGGTLKAVDTVSGKVRTIAEKLSKVSVLAFHPDGGMLTALVAGEVMVWKWPSMQQLQAPPHEGMVQSISFGKDGKLGIVSTKSEISLWRFNYGWKHADLQPREHRAGIRSILFSPVRSDTYITVGQTLTVWDNGSPFDILGHQSAVSAISFSHNGDSFFSGDIQGEVREFNTLRQPEVNLSFASEVKLADGRIARIENEKVVMDKNIIELTAMKPTGLAINEKGNATRLMIKTDQGRVVVVDIATGITILD